MRVILFLLACTIAWSAAAQTEQKFTRELFISSNSNGIQDTLPYRLYVPATRSNKLPVILWLHGKGERGKDNQKQLSNGILSVADSIISGKYPAIVIVPQCPPDQFWSEYDKSAPHITFAAESNKMEARVIQLLNEVTARYNGDRSRLYLIGISMGGFGVWDLITRYPEKFAAAIPICGGGDPTQANRIKKIPVWAFHGDADKVVNPSFTKDIMAELESLQPKGMSKFTMYPGVGHNAWDFALKENGLLQWLFSHQKDIQ